MRFRIVAALLLGLFLPGNWGQASTDSAPTNAVSPPISAPSPSTPTSTNAPHKIPEGKILEFVVPLSPTARVAVINSKNPPVEFAKVAIAVPPGFEPEIPTPILLINGTSDGVGSSIRLMPAYTNVALRSGWLVIAADGPFGKPPQDNPPWRWAMISSLLDHINKVWPASKRWPIASVGVSGGGKWAGVMGAILSQKGYNLVGVFMSGVNQDTASEAAKLYDPAVRFKQTPIFLASGTEDKLATPAHHQEVKEGLLNSGFAHVRLESFNGGHALSEGELRKALTWFIEHYGKEDESK